MSDSAPLRWIVAMVVVVVLAGVSFLFFRSRADDTGSGSQGTAATTTTGPADAAPPPNTPSGAFTAWIGAVSRGDLATACGLLTKDAVDRVERNGTCPASLVAAATKAGLATSAKELTVLGERIDGTRAEVSYQVNGQSTSNPAVLEQERGAWKVDLFAKPSGLGNIAGAESAACASERQTVETAIATYQAVNGSFPPDAKALVGDYLQQLPPNTRVNPDGTVTMVNACA